MKKLNMIFILGLLLLSMVNVALAADVSVRGAYKLGDSVPQDALGDVKLYLDTSSEPVITSFKWFNYGANWLMMKFGSLMFMNGIPFTSLSASEKADYLANGALSFDPTGDSRYVTLEEDKAAVQSGSFVAVLAEADHTWYNPTTQSYVQSRDPSIPSSVPANADVIPIVYKDKLTGETKMAYTIAGRTEMDFTALNSWTMKEYVPAGQSFSYVYDRDGAVAQKVETITPEKQSTPVVQEDVIVGQPLPDDVSDDDVVVPNKPVEVIDDTLFYVVMGSFVIVIVSTLIILLTKKKRR